MTGHVYIYGTIGDQVTINSVRSQIEASAKDYVVHIVSPGGDVFEGYGIYNILKNTGKPVVTHVEGLCASIATLIAFAGQKIVMNKASEFMIHNPNISDLKGESSDLRNVADQLDKIKGILIDVSGQRAARNGKIVSKEKLWDLYDQETWLTADEALQMGFVDEVADAIKAVAKVDITKFKMKPQSKLAKLMTEFKNFISEAKGNIKNEMTETLEDGSVIIVMTEDGDWTGKQVVREDGSPLEDGTYTLASGKTFTVSGGVIGEVAEPEAKNKEDEEMNNKIQELETQLAEMKAQKETAEAQAKAAQSEAVQAKAQSSKFQNRVMEVEKKFTELQAEVSKTLGDTSEEKKGPAFKNVDNKNQVIDPMGEELLAHLRNRNLIEQ